MNIPVVAAIILIAIVILAIVLIRNRKDRKGLEKDLDTDLNDTNEYHKDKEEM
jgi:uncharacterized protein YoxC